MYLRNIIFLHFLFKKYLLIMTAIYLLFAELIIRVLDEISTNAKLSILFAGFECGLSFFVVLNLHIKAKMERIIECFECRRKFRTYFE